MWGKKYMYNCNFQMFHVSVIFRKENELEFDKMRRTSLGNISEPVHKLSIQVRKSFIWEKGRRVYSKGQIDEVLRNFSLSIIQKLSKFQMILWIEQWGLESCQRSFWMQMWGYVNKSNHEDYCWVIKLLVLGVKYIWERPTKEILWSKQQRWGY